MSYSMTKKENIINACHYLLEIDNYGIMKMLKRNYELCYTVAHDLIDLGWEFCKDENGRMVCNHQNMNQDIMFDITNITSKYIVGKYWGD